MYDLLQVGGEEPYILPKQTSTILVPSGTEQASEAHHILHFVIYPVLVLVIAGTIWRGWRWWRKTKTKKK